MNQPSFARTLWIPFGVLILFVAAVSFRPLLPIDETRYMSVAWEMFLRRGWLDPLTMNFEPYHHKPPVLFWLINAAWAAFGVSRWAALIPVGLAALASVLLTAAMGCRLFPEKAGGGYRAALIMTASVPFLIYSTLVLFDLTLTVFVLLALTCVLLYRREGRWRHAAMAGLFMGLGVLTKGPVAFLYTLFPFVLGPVWHADCRPAKWYAGMALALGVSVLPVLLWLVPVLRQADGDFAFWLLWEQTAGRVTGHFGDAHVRPPYFYLPLVPVMFLPWVLFPAFWAGVRPAPGRLWGTEGGRFILCWLVPTFICFSFIGGKQPHYLVPLLPGAALLTALFLADMRTAALERTLWFMLLAVVAGQAVAAQTVFRAYDLTPVAAYVRAHPDHDWAFVRNYHAEIGFLARLEKPVTDLQPAEVRAWFATHPEGRAIIRYKNPEDVAAYHMLVDGPYRGKRLGIFSPADATSDDPP